MIERRRGRPRKKEGKRDCILLVHLTKEEKEAIRDAAKKEGTTVSDYVRASIFTYLD